MKQRGMARRASLVAAGTAMVAGLGLAGAGAATAAAPALKIKPGAIWTFQARGPQYIPCEQEVFASNGTFTEKNTRFGSHDGSSGTWTGGKSSIALVWTAGLDDGQVFGGSLTSSQREYKGSVIYHSINENARLLHKAVGGC